MKVVFLIAMAVQALAAPAPPAPSATPAASPQPVREKRSSYGGYGAAPVSYAQAPCGSAPIAVAAPSTYAINVPAHGSYGYQPHHAPAYGSYGAPAYSSHGYGQHYRDGSMEEEEMMSFPDMDHMSMARSYGYAAPQYGAGPGAVGLFPNANVGGCAVPLLLSCSPRVVQGRMVHHQQPHQPQYVATPAVATSYAPVVGAGYRAEGHPEAPHSGEHSETLHDASHEKHEAQHGVQS
ncbi:hypothetical protein JYU34_007737 [Plutella xylostella]|uniref:Uncharacterized protein n=1 Tax=Plutella xylostella TaxID=51655 RepID=A0ABQ7QR87_PLUXY|nr:hypothetical protein JYU34_007737 [Plutella xylostella]